MLNIKSVYIFMFSNYTGCISSNTYKLNSIHKIYLENIQIIDEIYQFRSFAIIG